MAKIPKLKLRPSLQQILFLTLLVMMALEGFVLHQAFYAAVNVVDPEAMPAPDGAPRVSLDLKQYNKLKAWIEENRAYELPEYNLFNTADNSTTTPIFSGRENPFAE